MKTKFIPLLALAGLLAFAGNVNAQDTTTPPADTPPTDVNVDAGAIRDLRIEFRQQRLEMLEQFLQARRELRQRLLNANEEDRAAILAEFRALYKDQIDAERELRKQLRNEIHDIRRTRRDIVNGG